jgi:hypothetical protein
MPNLLNCDKLKNKHRLERSLKLQRNWQIRVLFADQASIKNKYGLPSAGKEHLRSAAARRQNPSLGASVHAPPSLGAKPGELLLGKRLLHLFSIVVAETATLRDR